MAKEEKIVNKEDIIARLKTEVSEEKRLIGKIIGRVKTARKESGVKLNVNEKQLRANLTEIIKKWEERKVQKIINKTLEQIKLSLQKKEKVIFWGYFGLQVQRSASRKARNPRTGEEIIIKEKNRISFRASPKLKREINK